MTLGPIATRLALFLACCSQACYSTTTDVVVRFRDPAGVRVRPARPDPALGAIPAGRKPAVMQAIASEQAPLWVKRAEDGTITSNAFPDESWWASDGRLEVLMSSDGELALRAIARAYEELLLDHQLDYADAVRHSQRDAYPVQAILHNYGRRLTPECLDHLQEVVPDVHEALLDILAEERAANDEDGERIGVPSEDRPVERQRA